MKLQQVLKYIQEIFQIKLIIMSVATKTFSMVVRSNGDESQGVSQTYSSMVSANNPKLTYFSSLQSYKLLVLIQHQFQRHNNKQHYHYSYFLSDYLHSDTLECSRAIFWLQFGYCFVRYIYYWLTLGIIESVSQYSNKPSIFWQRHNRQSIYAKSLQNDCLTVIACQVVCGYLSNVSNSSWHNC